MNERKEFIVNLVKEAQALIKERISETFEIDIKNNNQSDLVTAVDVEIEKFLVKRISEKYPNDGFLTEENTVESEDKEYIWIIDPIDGTMNFVYMLQDFAISVALYKNKVGEIGVVCDVMNDEMIVGVRNEGVTVNGKKVSNLNVVTLRESIVDVSLRTIARMRDMGIANLLEMSRSILSHRNMGSAALRISHIALGRIHMYISDTLCIWDFAAGVIILNEVGGYHNYQAEEIKFDASHVNFFGANNKAIADELKEKFYIHNEN